MSGAGIMLIALALDAALGWPTWLFARISHPVVWLGALINALEARLNPPGGAPVLRRFGGVALLLFMLGITGASAVLLTRLLPEGWPGALLAGILGWPLIAARSLHDHVAAVARPLGTGDLAAARVEVGKIVGRDPNQLDEADVARATIESLAENTSDGIIAPLFWGALLGLPGLFAYKAVNTLDSMVGHRSERFEAFGWASARFDDLLNLAPARLTGLLFSVIAGRPRAGWAAMRRDAPRHRSPNAGWPEAAMADALGVRLSGPRRYEGRIAVEPFVNETARDPMAGDILTALTLYRRALLGAALLFVLLALRG